MHPYPHPETIQRCKDMYPSLRFEYKFYLEADQDEGDRYLFRKLKYAGCQALLKAPSTAITEMNRGKKCLVIKTKKGSEKRVIKVIKRNLPFLKIFDEIEVEQK